VPDGTAFATKPALARQMITRSLDARTPAAWVTAHEVYGQDPALRAELARRGTGYVVAILPTRNPAALVSMATTTSGHSPRLPLPPNSPRPPMITKCRWRIKRQISQ
jgi:SRSO17 transposase